MTAVELICQEIDEPKVAGLAKDTLSIVIATDGSDAAAAAFQAAVLIEQRRHCSIHVLAVLEPLPLIVPGPEAIQIPPEIDEQRADGLRRAVQEQVGSFDHWGKWPSEIRTGRPAEMIAQFVDEQGADLLIIGSHKHGLWSRVLGEETATEIARCIGIPVLVAAQDMPRLPKRIMVAMDIKPFGLERLPAALCALAEKGTVSCVHVKPRAEFLGIDWAEFDREYQIAMHERFGVMERSLEKAGFRCDLIALNGDVTRELVQFADYSKAELLVVGVTHRGGHGGGRLAGRMLRQVKGSVLLIPTDVPERR
jgi:nucleotide-binding universal stress UspA family protein